MNLSHAMSSGKRASFIGSVLIELMSPTFADKIGAAMTVPRASGGAPMEHAAGGRTVQSEPGRD
jgi:hypothetical protein